MRILAILFFASVAIFFAVYGENGVTKLRELRLVTNSKIQQNLKHERELKELAKHIDAINKDERVLEKIARSDFGLARPNDLVVFFTSNNDISEIKGDSSSETDTR